MREVSMYLFTYLGAQLFPYEANKNPTSSSSSCGQNVAQDLNCAKSLQGEAPCGSAVYARLDEISPAPSPQTPLPLPHPPLPDPPAAEKTRKTRKNRRHYRPARDFAL